MVSQVNSWCSSQFRDGVVKVLAMTTVSYYMAGYVMNCKTLVQSIIFSLLYRRISIMALRNAWCRLLAKPQRCAIISASRAQGTAAPVRWGKYNNNMQGTYITLLKGHCDLFIHIIYGFDDWAATRRNTGSSSGVWSSEHTKKNLI